jgi:hypothetical protein
MSRNSFGPAAVLALLLCVLVLAAPCLLGDGKEIFNDYLRRPRLPRFSMYHTTNRKLLQKLELQPGSSPESVVDQLVEFGKRLEWNYERTTCETLISLAKPDEGCTSELTNLVISIYAQLDRPRLEPLEQFLDHFGKQKFGQCASKANEEIKREPRAEYVFDDFFRLRLRLNQDASDLELCQSIRNSTMNFSLPFYDCRDLTERFGTMINVINLAKALGADNPPLDARLDKLNEYNRFCPLQMDF